MRFTIIVVALNAGEELKKTVDSILCQTYTDYEIIVKDGGSVDGSLEALPGDRHIKLIKRSDKGIYDAMNQAVVKMRGDYVLFLNCGDYLKNGKVLARVAKAVAKSHADIYYGDLYRREQDSTDIAPGRISDFVCYRNVPCHQVCFYSRRLFSKRAYLTKYTVRSDYEHFLYCVYSENARCEYIPLTICSYQGGGFSETEEHRKEAALEHKEITEHYLGKKTLIYRLIMILTLQPLREKLAQSASFSKIYHGVKGLLYGRKTGGNKNEGIVDM